MLFSDLLPENLKEYPNTSQFVEVLDGLQVYKHSIISKFAMSENFGIFMEEKWLRKKLDEYGAITLPTGYPIQILQQYLLNVDTVCGLRGSKVGVELYCSLMSFGEVTIDDSEFYHEADFIILDSLSQGHITDNNTGSHLHLVDDSDTLNPAVSLGINIKSKFFNGSYPEEAALIKKHIEDSIKGILGFSPKVNIAFTYQSRTDFYFHKLLNPYFV